LLVAHDHRVVPYADQTFQLNDGLLTEQERIPELAWRRFSRGA
jgi:hypothetical protein